MIAKKGVSPVIATILMVMITVGLVAFSYSWFMAISKHQQEDVYSRLSEMEKKAQEVDIGTVFVNGTGLYFQLIALKENKYAIDMNGTNFYINGVPQSVQAWPGYSKTCTSGYLAPRESCYGMIPSYTTANCHMNSVFKVKIAWNGREIEERIEGCTNP